MEKRLTICVSIWGNVILGMLNTNKILVSIHIVAAVVLLTIYRQKCKNKW